MQKASDNIKFHDFSLFQTIPNFDNVRRDRMKLFVNIGLTLIIINSIIWAVIWHQFGYPIAVALTLCLLPLAFVIYKILKSGNVKFAFALLMLVLSTWILSIAVLASGPGGDYGGSVHSYYLTLAALIYFIYIGQPRAEQWGFTAFMLLLFLIFEIPLIDFEPMAQLPESDRQFAARVTWIGVIATFFVFFVWIAQDVYEVEKRLNAANEKKSELLDNIFPPQVVKKLSEEGKTFAESIDMCTVLILDIVNFTALTRQLRPEQLVELLNKVFGEFDDIVKAHKAEKIKTIGDAYVAVAGVPVADPEHASKMIRIAKAFIKAVKTYPEVDIRIGINSGPVTAGIMGKRKILYDIWGETVNIATLLEQTAKPSSILISEKTYALIKEKGSFRHFGVFNSGSDYKFDAFEIIPESAN